MKTREVRDGMAHIGTVHHFKLKNLDAGKQYQYAIEAVEVQGMERKDSRFGQKESSNSYTVNTFSKNDPQLYFLVYNDMHETPESFGLLRKLAPSKQPDLCIERGYGQFDAFRRSFCEQCFGSYGRGERFFGSYCLLAR
ncbi:hypothetical protein ACFQ2C_00400 [Sphingobacterium daejeonense]|uniref:Uncharacterized protein n=1 Tax=Sphingobacterium daejeonense TaxID=371142 RepID=A0ABW3RG62_9SPHI